MNSQPLRLLYAPPTGSKKKVLTDCLLQWSHVEDTNKSAIQEKKIRVVFLPALDNSTTSTPAKSNGVKNTNGAPRSPTPDAVTPQVSRASGDAASTERSPATTVQSTISSGIAAVSSAVPTSSEQLKQQLADAQGQILKLKDQIAKDGLRQRKPAGGNEVTEKSSTGATSTAVQQPPTSGVSVQIVAALCLLSFLLAYFFF